MAETLSVRVDVAQPRISRDRLATLIAGAIPGAGIGDIGVEFVDGWDSPYHSNIFYDPFRKTAMLRPAPLTDAWYTNAAGIYARLGKANYTLVTAAKWREHNELIAGDIYLHADDVNEIVRTTGTYDKNRGAFLAWFNYNTTSDDFLQMECWWSTNAAATGPTHVDAKVGLRFYSRGKVEVYRNGTKADRDYAIHAVRDKSDRDAVADDKSSRYNAFVLLPFRRRELLVLRQDNQGFVHTFDDIDETESDPIIITAASYFFWKVPNGKATVQAAPLSFAASGYVTGRKTIFRDAPADGETVDTVVYSDAPGYGTNAVTGALYEEDNSGAFTADGEKTEARVRVDFTGDGISTMFLLGIQAAFPGEVRDTNDEEVFELIDHLTAVELSVPESPSDVSLTLGMFDPVALAAAGFDRPITVSNRPIQAEIGLVRLLDGATDPPEFKESVAEESRSVMIDCRDRWKAFESYILRDPTPLDGMTLPEAFAFLAKLPGFGEYDLDIEDIDFTLPTGGSMFATGDFALLMHVGDNVGQWIRRLQETYIPQSFVGWVPVEDRSLFRVQTYDGKGTDPDVMLWRTVAAAEAAHVGDGLRYVYRKYRDGILEPEANEVWAAGLDPMSKLPVLAYGRDTESQQVETPPSARPDNWLGEIRYYSWSDPGLQSQDAVNRAADVLYNRLTQIRYMAEWESALLFKDDGTLIWRGDNVELEDFGVYRVTSLSGRFVLEPNGQGRQSRPFRYTGELIPETATVQVEQDEIA